MFAFALWDERNGSALLARDRLGVKPLYYHFDGRRLIFASELKSVLAVPDVPAELDATALLDYLTFGFVPAPKSIFRHIRKLEAGTMLQLREGRLESRRYWRLRHHGWSNAGIEQVADGLWHMLREATRLRLAADVPMAAFLSGGLDSAAVAAAMGGLVSGPVSTLTCGFDVAGFDERGTARRTAEILGTCHESSLVLPDAVNIADALASHFDEPFADASAIPTYYLSREARRRVVVALSGDGADELLAGYRRYRFDCHEEAMRRWIPRRLRAKVLGPLGRRWPRRSWIPRPLRAGATLQNVASDAATAHASSIATMPLHDAKALLRVDVLADTVGYDSFDAIRALYAECDAPDHLSKCQYVDICFGLPEGILTKVDRASMAHALEVRSPMLDYRFAESCWSVPPGLRLHRGIGKFALREALRRRVDPRLAMRTKRGFEAPLDAWFDGPLREQFEDRCLAAGSMLHELVRPTAIEGIWRGHRSGRRRAGANLWKLLMLAAWCDRPSRLRDPSLQHPQSSPPCIHS